MNPIDDDAVIVRVSRHFTATPERVFDAWFDPATLGRWLFATPGGEMRRVEVDARVGGGFVVAEQRPDGLAEHVGRYLEIDRPRRLVFLFAVEAETADADADRVTVEIVPTADGCELQLTHAMGAQYAAYAARTEHGWATILASLARHLGVV